MEGWTGYVLADQLRKLGKAGTAWHIEQGGQARQAGVEGGQGRKNTQIQPLVSGNKTQIFKCFALKFCGYFFPSSREYGCAPQ